MRKNTWVEIDEIPGNRLASKWRYLLCKALRQAPPHDPDLQRAIIQGYQDHRGFQVYTESFYPKGMGTAQYIGRYLGHPPLATSYLTGYDGHQIIFWYIDTPAQTVICSALDFISLLVPRLRRMMSPLRVPSFRPASSWISRCWTT